MLCHGCVWQDEEDVPHPGAWDAAGAGSAVGSEAQALVTTARGTWSGSSSPGTVKTANCWASVLLLYLGK